MSESFTYTKPVSEIKPDVIGKTSHRVNGLLGGLCQPYRRKKWWGEELTYFNNSDIGYCAKLLHFKKGGHTSLHLHAGKHETLVVVQGTLTLEVILDKMKTVHKLKQGEAWVMVPGVPHQLIAADDDVIVIEASTIDRDDDSVRIYS